MGTLTIINVLSFGLWIIWVVIGAMLALSTYEDYKKGNTADFGIAFPDPDITTTAYLLLTIVLAPTLYFINIPP